VRARRRLLVAAAILALPIHEAAARPGPFEYLYVEANEGASSGGHAAVRFADRCYHFQHVDQGRIQLVRESFAQFEHQYRIAGNRAIHARRIELDDADYEHLQAIFEEHYREQQRDFALLEAMTGDRELLTDLARGRASTPRIPGTGYFFADEESSDSSSLSARSPAIDALAKRLRRLHGDETLSLREQDVRDAIASLAPRVGDLPDGSADEAFSRRYRDHLAALSALAVLRHGIPARATIAAPGDGALALSEREIAVLRRTRRQIEDDLTRLFASSRRDWGVAMLIGLARLDVVAASIDTRQLSLLDVYREDAPVVPAAQVRRHRARLRALLAERYGDVRDARRAFFAGRSFDESRLSRLEVAASLAVELDRATRSDTDLRVHTHGFLPEKGAEWLDAPRPELDGAELDAALIRARALETSYAEELSRRYPYDLIEHNCVTELLRLLAGADLQAHRDGAAALETRLAFVPFLSSRALAGLVGQTTYRRLPSYREQALMRMYESENDALVYLRESNVLTSTLYERERDDSAFFFFTDDAFLPRPILGLANLTTGIAATLAGVAALPIDGGRVLGSGARGALFSVPEIGFVSIRKGSFSFVPRRWLEGAEVEELHDN